MRELEVSATQAPSLPAGNLVHPLLGRRVVITHGECRGYNGIVQDVRNTSITVEVHTLFAGAISPYQSYPWHHIKLMYVLLYIGQGLIAHFSLGQKRKRWPNPIRVTALTQSLLCLGLIVHHHGP
jgi:uncharacterized membrane protein SirB2